VLFAEPIRRHNLNNEAFRNKLIRGSRLGDVMQDSTLLVAENARAQPQEFDVVE